MRYTLLDMVQSILSSMDSDEVNSISDNTESLQVAYIVRDCYMDIVSRLNLDEHYTLFELNATSGDTPTVMTLPSGIVKLQWIKYDNVQTQDGDTAPVYTDIGYLPFQEFMRRCDLMTDEADDTIERFTFTMNSESFPVAIRNDRGPSFWTSPDDSTIIFDAYDEEIDSNLQKSKTKCYGQRDLEFELEDTWEPELDPKQQLILLNEAKSQAFAELKQTTNANAEKKARRQWVSAQREKRALRPGERTEMSRLPYYGRK